MKLVITKAEWELRQRQWGEFNRWEREQVQPEFSPEEVLAFISTILEWAPADVRTEDSDPERQGVRRMHALLGATQH